MRHCVVMVTIKQSNENFAHDNFKYDENGGKFLRV